MKVLSAVWAALLCAGLFSSSAAAQSDSQTIFTYKRWEVRVVAFEDASLACVAQVNHDRGSFAIWANGNGPPRLQFFSSEWDLGQSQADVVVRIDRRRKWDLTNADLNENSVLFDLPSNNAAERFLGEVLRGNVIYLFNTRGHEVGRWSLAGSSASIRTLTECVDLLETGADGNPFD